VCVELMQRLQASETVGGITMDNGDSASVTNAQSSTMVPESEQVDTEDDAPVAAQSEDSGNNSKAVNVSDTASSDKGIGAETFASYQPAAQPVEDYIWPRAQSVDIEQYHEMSRWRSWLYFFIAVAALVAGLGTVLGIFLLVEHQNYHPLTGAMIIAGSWLAAIVIIVGGRLSIVLRTKLSPTESPSNKRKEANRSLDERTLNQQSLKKYHDLTQQQARSSYVIAQIAILVGLLLLIGAAIIILRASAPTVQVLVGALGVVGSTLSGYVGATSIGMYNRAQAQMNFYYAQPLVQSYILEAERISNCLSSKRKDSALEKVIAQTLEGAAVAGYLISRGADESRSSRRFRAARSSVGTAGRAPSPASASVPSDELSH